jgi:hypothetical protein
MRKIHPGFIAIAILTGPAALITAHQKISEYLSPALVQNTETPDLIRQTYERCSAPPKLQRTVQCHEFVNWFEACVAAGTQCEARSAFDLTTRLDLSPPKLKQVPKDNITLTAAKAK